MHNEYYPCVWVARGAEPKPHPTFIEKVSTRRITTTTNRRVVHTKPRRVGGDR